MKYIHNGFNNKIKIKKEKNLGTDKRESKIFKTFPDIYFSLFISTLSYFPPVSVYGFIA